MPYLHRSQAEDLFGPYFSEIHDIVLGADEDYRNFYSPEAKVTHDPTCRAKNRSCHMIERANKLAASMPGKIRSFQSEGLQGIVIEEKVCLIFKKFDRVLRTRNNMTPHMENFLGQVPIASIPAIHYFVAGYTENPVTGALTGIYVAYPNGHGNNYFFTLSDGDEGVVEDLFTPELPPDEPPPLKPKNQPGEVVKFPTRKDSKNSDES